MQEILKEIIKKEEEATLQIEQAQKSAEQIIANAKNEAEKIIMEAQSTAKRICEELQTETEQQIKKTHEQILDIEKAKNQQIQSKWEKKIILLASRVFQKIIDIKY